MIFSCPFTVRSYCSTYESNPLGVSAANFVQYSSPYSCRSKYHVMCCMPEVDVLLVMESFQRGSTASSQFFGASFRGTNCGL